ncbi:MAG TPA: hypothetical protein VIR57_20175 [Chloroflexota bacterium]
MALFTLALLAASPTSLFAQAASAPGSPGQGATTGSASPAQAPGAAQPPTAASASAASAGSVAPAAASAPAVRGLPTPVGGNAPRAAQEPVPLFAYLLIVLGAVWFFAAIAGIVRLLSRPRSGPYAASVPEPEMDRPFLSFIMPFAALVSVAIVVTVWGLIFLQTSHISELYPLAIDLFVVCLVMLIATVASLRGGRQPRAEVH